MGLALNQFITRPITQVNKITGIIYMIITGILESLIVLLVLFLANPLGFLISISLMMYFEYLIIKSIIKGKDSTMYPFMIINHIKKYVKNSNESLTSFESAIMDAILNKGQASVEEISNTVGVTVDYTRKNVINLLDRGYIARTVNIDDNNAFYFIDSENYKKKAVLFL